MEIWTTSKIKVVLSRPYDLLMTKYLIKYKLTFFKWSRIRVCLGTSQAAVICETI